MIQYMIILFEVLRETIYMIILLNYFFPGIYKSQPHSSIQKYMPV